MLPSFHIVVAGSPWQSCPRSASSILLPLEVHVTQAANSGCATDCAPAIESSLAGPECLEIQGVPLKKVSEDYRTLVRINVQGEVTIPEVSVQAPVEDVLRA